MGAITTDPIADMLTRIRNALMAGHAQVSIPASKIKERIATILLEEGYILGFRRTDNDVQGEIEVDLKYVGRRKPAIVGLKRVSSPGCRVYKKFTELPRIRNGLGIAIVSTSQGVFTDRSARELRAGGEILCYIW